MKDEKEVLVFADWLENENVIGTLYVSSARGKQVYSFEFTNSWLYNFSKIKQNQDLYNTEVRQFGPNYKQIWEFI